MKLRTYLALRPNHIITQMHKSEDQPNLYGALEEGVEDSIFTLFSLTPAPTIITSFTFVEKIVESFLFVPGEKYVAILLYAKGGELILADIQDATITRREFRLRNYTQLNCSEVLATRTEDICIVGDNTVAFGRLTCSPLRLWRANFPHLCTSCILGDYIAIGAGKAVHLMCFKDNDPRRVRTTPLSAEVEYVVSAMQVLYAICEDGSVVAIQDGHVIDEFKISAYDYSMHQQVKIDQSGRYLCISSTHGTSGCVVIDLRLRSETFHANATGLQLACEFADEMIILGEQHCIKVYSFDE